MHISTSDFIDFVQHAGQPKLTKVNQLLKRPEYDPKADYYKVLRDGIVAFHEKGSGNKKDLEDLMQVITDSRQEVNYPNLIESYQRWLGRKKPRWFQPPVSCWEHGNLSVRVNPELGFEMNEKSYLIKLYFKKQPIRKKYVDLILTMMNESLEEDVQGEVIPAILDVRSKKLYTADNILNDNLSFLLAGEAESFITVWEGLAAA